jgi:hypothetical protein
MPVVRGQPNETLTHALREVGWSAYDLAKRINQAKGSGYVHRTTPYMWCAQGVVPRPPLPALVAGILSQEAGRLIRPADLWPGTSDEGPLQADQGLGDPWHANWAVVIPKELDITTHPQEIMCVSGSDLLNFTQSWSPDRWKPGALSGGNDANLRADPVLDHLEGELARLRALDDGAGGSALLTIVSSQQRLLTLLAKQYGDGSWQARRCLNILAQYCQFAGWLAMDLGEHARAQRSFFLSLRLCELVHDDNLYALVISCLAMQAASRGRLKDALHLSKAATDVPTKSPAASAILWMRRARTSATLGDSRDFQTSLMKARTLLNEPETDTQPRWSYWLTEDILCAEEGRCWVDLSTPRKAQVHLSRSLLNSGNTGRDRVLYGAVLAQAHLDAGELDQACVELKETMDFLPGTSSRRCLDLLATLTQSLNRVQLPQRHRTFIKTVDTILSGHSELKGTQL